MPKRKPPNASPEVGLNDTSSNGLTYLEELFCRHYIETANASEAYRRAGGRSPRADAESNKMMSRPHVQRHIDQLRASRLAAVAFSAEEVLNRIVSWTRADLLDIYTESGALKPIAEWPSVWRSGLVEGIETIEECDKDGNLTGYVKKVKMTSRVKVLELAGKHVDISAWKMKLEVDTSDVLKAMVESFSRDTWVPQPARPADQAPASPGPNVASVLDG